MLGAFFFKKNEKVDTGWQQLYDNKHNLEALVLIS